MAIVKWDPFRDILTLRDRMDRLFDDSLARLKGTEEDVAHSAWSPAVDIYETVDNLVINVEIPGMNKDDITVEVKNNTLCLKGERKFEKDVKEENYHRIERSYGAFYRVFSLPANINQNKVKASYKNGVLEISIPKEEKSKPKQVSVDVE